MSRVLDTVDVAVLGGGAVGSAVAYFLSGEGARVVLLERGAPGSGTSGRCEGNLLLGTKTEDDMLRLAQESIRLFRTLDSELSIDFHFKQEGSLLLYTAEAEERDVQGRIDFLTDRGVTARRLTPQQLTDAEPRLGPWVTAAVECDEDISVYPPALVQALVDGATSRRALVRTGTLVKEILRDHNGHVAGVETDAGTVRCKWVINCLGVWAPPLSESVGVPLPIQPRQGVLLVTEPVPGFLRRNVTEAGYISSRFAGPGEQSKADDYGLGFIAEPTFRGNLLIGSSRAFRGHDTSVSMRIVDDIIKRALPFLPELSSVNLVRTFAGLRPWTPDGRPIISTTRVPGYIVATGHEGEGIGQAPVTGRIVADLVRDGYTDLPAELLRADRFERSEATHA